MVGVILRLGVCIFSLLVTSVVNAATISPTQYVEVSFGQLENALPTANFLSINVVTGNPTDLLTLSLYDGPTLLGQATSGPQTGLFLPSPGQRWFDFISTTNPFSIPDTTRVDFSSIEDGTFDFRMLLSSSVGVFDLYEGPFGSEADFSQLTTETDLGPIGPALDSYFFTGAAITEMPVVVPVPNSILFIMSGLIVLLQRCKQA